MAGCLALKGRVVHCCAVVCFVGDGAEYDVWNLVQISALRNRSALHLGAGTVEFLDQMVFHFFAGNKLVTADHASAEYLDFRIDFLGRLPLPPLRGARLPGSLKHPSAESRRAGIRRCAHPCRAEQHRSK